MGIGDWGLGIGDWGFGVWGDAPNPKTQTPIIKFLIFIFLKFFYI